MGISFEALLYSSIQIFPRPYLESQWCCTSHHSVFNCSLCWRLSPHHLQWVDPPVTAGLRLAAPGGGCHDTLDAAQSQFHSISSQQTSILLIILLSFSFFSHFASPPLTTILALYFSPFSSPSYRRGPARAHCSRGHSHITRNSSSSSSSKRTGRCAEACFPPSCRTGKTSRSPLISSLIYLRAVCVLVRAGTWKVGREDYHTLGVFTTPASATQNQSYSGYFYTDMLFIL